MVIDNDVDLISMAVKVYENSSPTGDGYSRPWHKPLTREEVFGQMHGETPHLFTIDQEKGNLFMDYVNGRRCKCWVSNWCFNDREYDQVHGPGAAERLVSELEKRRPRKEMTLTGDSLEDVRHKIADSVPQGCSILQQRIINDGTPKTVKRSAYSADDAFQQAKSAMPTEAIIIDENIIETKTQQKETITIEAFDEQAAKEKALLGIPPNATLLSKGDGVLITTGRKGLLGFGRKPNIYRFTYAYDVASVMATVTFRNPATVLLVYEEPLSGNKLSSRSLGSPSKDHKTLTNKGLMWQRLCDGVERTQAEAFAYCKSLSLAGYTDWRLPTLQEFNLLGDNLEESSYDYWTATSEPRLGPEVAYINDGTTMFKTNRYYVLAVRDRS